MGDGRTTQHKSAVKRLVFAGRVSFCKRALVHVHRRVITGTYIAVRVDITSIIVVVLVVECHIHEESELLPLLSQLRSRACVGYRVRAVGREVLSVRDELDVGVRECVVLR